ncbi:MAG: hypothetical protein V3V41_07945 [Candidatus Heimdallarchaeota archaeon]
MICHVPITALKKVSETLRRKHLFECDYELSQHKSATWLYNNHPNYVKYNKGIPNDVSAYNVGY